MHAELIRDADKLDNCRVKLEERVEVLLGGASAKEAGAQEISQRVWEHVSMNAPYCLRIERQIWITGYLI